MDWEDCVYIFRHIHKHICYNILKVMISRGNQGVHRKGKEREKWGRIMQLYFNLKKNKNIFWTRSEVSTGIHLSLLPDRGLNVSRCLMLLVCDFLHMKDSASSQTMGQNKPFSFPFSSRYFPTEVVKIPNMSLLVEVQWHLHYLCHGPLLLILWIS